ncbi:YfcE family phosphodiesterase [Archaeoglobus neptunius]|uniref:YfcE family phosphodiesterase n=1 Tax=Archaeoglobus neptunius TaxID=2798580 RepID=UPI0019278B41|nr:YfcE family phosphodiesterase [Archaeoglobus neptunius]
MKLLIFGDSHIPERASKIPSEFDHLFKTLDYDAVICTGDLTSGKVLEYIRSLSDEYYVVRGNMDSLPLPEYQVVRGMVGVIHGYQVYPRGNREQLLDIAKKMKVKVLISGHTHTPDVYRGEVVLLNPGSATGVWGGGRGPGVPSFMLVDVGDKLGVTLFKLEREITEERFEIEL